MKIECEIYKSKKNEELYLYIDKNKGFGDVPQVLLDKINRDQPILTLALAPERKLARADVGKVIAEICEKGFYLQMPPLDPITVQDNLQ